MLAQTEAAHLFAFDNSYARLPDRFFARLPPTPVAAPRLVRLNEKLARHLGLDPAKLATPEGVEILAGNRVPKRGEPLAMAYAGHQFGNFRAAARRRTRHSSRRGYRSRRRAPRHPAQGLRPDAVLPEGRRTRGARACPARIHRQRGDGARSGFPTTRALAAVTTGETVRRETPLPGAVLTRVASSHIRVGTFQFFAARGDVDAIRHLADHVIARHYPEAAGRRNRYRALLDLVIARQAELVAKWLLVGFIHGVMNTDNMSIAGETIDYGPCAFMDAYDPATVYSSIDTVGRYAYGNQPRIAQWNLARLAETLLPLLAEDKDAAVEEAQEALGAFRHPLRDGLRRGPRRKLGLFQARPDDLSLAQDLLERMAAQRRRFHLDLPPAVRRGCQPRRRRGRAQPVYRSDRLRRLGGEMAPSACRGRRGSGETSAGRRCARPTPHSFPRNHLVEEAISAAVNNGDFAPFENLLTVLSRPYEDQPAFGRYADPPRPDQVVHQTFCGT